MKSTFQIHQQEITMSSSSPNQNKSSSNPLIFPIHPKHNTNLIERYQNLKLKESLAKPYQFSLACKELSFFLRNYSKFPKNLQTLILEETLFAFSLLPRIQSQSAILAASCLLQSAEFALPKQKRVLAVKEHKNAVVACKRKSKVNEEEQGFSVLPQDVLVHLFSFLDLQSLVSASTVCWSWNAAAKDNHLWKFLYATFFTDYEDVSKHNARKTHERAKNEGKNHLPKDTGMEVYTDWRFAFGTAYKETCSRKFKSHRGYCSSCSSVVWLSGNRCSNEPQSKDGSKHQIKPVSTQQIVEYVLNGFLSSESSSDSDSDSDDEDVSIFKLWAYPRQIR